MLTITMPADDLALLTDAEMRVAAGLGAGDSSQDAALRALGLRVAASIMSECNIAVGSGGEPTLLRETLTETFRRVSKERLILSRRHEVEITSVVEDDIALTADDYEVDPESGLLMRLSDDESIWWCARLVTVVYAAGFDDVPGDLKQAALDFFRSSYMESSRDPLVKSERTDIPGVMEQERQYWVGSVPGQSNEGAVPDVVSGQLKRFRNMAVG